MSLDFDDKLKGQGKNLSQSIFGLKWFKLAKIVNQNMPPCKNAVHESPVQAIQNAFLSRLKCEIPPNDSMRR
jgi:hypothetical protein